MTADPEDRRGEQLRRTVLLVNELLRGRTLDARAVMQVLGFRLAGARRQLDALENLYGVVRERGRRAKALRLDPQGDRAHTANLQTVFAACLASGFASLFGGTRYARAFADMRELVVRNATNRGSFANLEQKFLFLSRGGDVGLQQHPEHLDNIVTALVDEHRVAFEYEHWDGRRELVRADPLSLIVHQHQLYLVAQSLSGEARWPYRFSRIQKLRVLDEHFKYPTPSHYSPEKLFSDSIGVFVSEAFPVAKICLRLSGDLARYVQSHQWHASQHA